MRKDILNLKFQKFLLKYGPNYSEEALSYIKENFGKPIDYKTTPDVLRQIYTDFGMYPDEENFYLAHLKKIRNNFDITKNILEVGCGPVPAFGNILAKEQLRLGSGTITVYDPRLVVEKPKYPNMKLYKKNFTLDTSVSNYDLITGIFPCEATEDIIKSACTNKKDFYVAMCGCTHFDYFYIIMHKYMVSPYMYQQYVISKAEELLENNNNGRLCVDVIDDNFEIDYPILYNKKS